MKEFGYLDSSEVVGFLLENGARVDLTDSKGRTAFMIAEQDRDRIISDLSALNVERQKLMR